LFLDAQADMEAQDFQTSLDKYLVVLEIAPDSVNTLKRISYIYAQLGDTEQSLNYMIKVVEKDPKDDMVRTNLGNTSFDNGNFEDAVNWYLAAADINPANIDNYFNMALAYSRLKDEDNSLMAYEKILEIEPDNLDALIYASGLEEKRGNEEKASAYLESALGQYTKLLETDPENVEVIAKISTIYEKIGNMPESIIYLKKAIDLDPENVTWISYLTYVLTLEKNYEEALIYAEKWLVLEPDSERAISYSNLAKQMSNK
jgi:tetratricopeptide (TPR) repeat protein